MSPFMLQTSMAGGFYSLKVRHVLLGQSLHAVVHAEAATRGFNN